MESKTGKGTVCSIPCTGSIGRHRAIFLDVFHALCFRLSHVPQQLDRLPRSDRIHDISEINTSNVLFRRHVDYQLPDWLPNGFCPQIPKGVDNGASGKVDDTFFRSDPPQL